MLKLALGVLVLIPTLPEGITVSKVAPVEEAMSIGVEEALPIIVRLALGVLVPSPRRLLVSLKKKLELFSVKALAP